jgi:hypothetical protein
MLKMIEKMNIRKKNAAKMAEIITKSDKIFEEKSTNPIEKFRSVKKVHFFYHML